MCFCDVMCFCDIVPSFVYDHDEETFPGVLERHFLDSTCMLICLAFQRRNSMISAVECKRTGKELPGSVMLMTGFIWVTP